MISSSCNEKAKEQGGVTPFLAKIGQGILTAVADRSTGAMTVTPLPLWLLTHSLVLQVRPFFLKPQPKEKKQSGLRDYPPMA